MLASERDFFASEFLADGLYHFGQRPRRRPFLDRLRLLLSLCGIRLAWPEALRSAGHWDGFFGIIRFPLGRNVLSRSADVGIRVVKDECSPHALGYNDGGDHALYAPGTP